MHQYELIASHGEDAPNKSLDTYEWCSRCGTVKHDYRHNGGRTSPSNFPVFFKVDWLSRMMEPPCTE